MEIAVLAQGAGEAGATGYLLGRLLGSAVVGVVVGLLLHGVRHLFRRDRDRDARRRSLASSVTVGCALAVLGGVGSVAQGRAVPGALGALVAFVVALVWWLVVRSRTGSSSRSSTERPEADTS